jgi:NAD(P)-dependent dehydrogenase (short-subunit alcohol dehydrogenase family)
MGWDIRARNAAGGCCRLDYAFNNAGIEQNPQPLPDQTEETFDQIMAINVKGVWLAMKYETPAILAPAGRGAIVNSSSIVGLIGFPKAAIYTASKHAVIGLTKAVALEYAQQKIRVNAVSPGAVDTPMFDRFAGKEDSLRAQVASMHAMGRVARPEEIADAVLFLCSDRPRFVTGHTLAVDGGFVAAWTRAWVDARRRGPTHGYVDSMVARRRRAQMRFVVVAPVWS